MLKRFGCILTALMLTLCLSLGNFAGVVAVADDETYTVITSSSKVLSSGNYKLTSDITLKSYIDIHTDADVTIDLNGYTLSYSGDYVILVNEGTLTLTDSSSDGTGSVVQKGSTKNACAIKISNGGVLNMSGGNLYAYRALWVYNGTANITAGTIQASDECAVYISTGSLDISGTEEVKIEAMDDDSADYGIYFNTALVYVTISNPNTYVRASSNSSAINVKTSSRINITAGHYTSDVSKYVKTEGYSCNETGDADYPYVVTADVVEEIVLPEFYGEALTLDGSVGVTFYFNMTGVSSPEAYTMTAKIGEDGETESISAGQTKTLDDSIEYYRYTVYVKPNEYCTTIYASLTDGTNTTETYEYSVYDYCIYAIENDWEESDLCKALLNYGDYACAYDPGISQYSFEAIDGWTDPVQEEWTADLSEYSGTETPGVAKTILLGSTVAIRLYLTSGVASESDVFTVGGEELELYSVDDENYSYYVEFKVSAADMVKTFTVMKNGEEFTSYSVLSYVENIVEKDDDTALVNLCKAIYYYSVAASKYSGWK